MSSVTLQQVAQEIGVSPQTVSNVLNHRTKESWPSTRERATRIREAAARLGYRPNAAARTMATGRHGAVGLVIGTRSDRSPLPYDLLVGLDTALAKIDQHIMLARLSDEKLTDLNYVPRILKLWMVDGLLISYQNVIPPRMMELIRASRLPAVWLNSKQETDCIYHDDMAGGRMATEHLLQLGHTKIAYLECSYFEGETHYSATDRRLGYEGAMREAGLSPVSVYGRRVDGGQRETWVRTLLSREDRPTAVVCYGDETFALLMAAERLGIRVPEDLSVVTFVDPQPLSYFDATLTQVKLDHSKLAGEAVKMLDEKLRGDDEPQAGVAVMPEVVVRRSAARVTRPQ